MLDLLALNDLQCEVGSIHGKEEAIVQVRNSILSDGNSLRDGENGDSLVLFSSKIVDSHRHCKR